jgi:hypothetical protein
MSCSQNFAGSCLCIIEAIRVSQQTRIMTQGNWIKKALQQAVLGGYVRGLAFRRFVGAPLLLLDTGFLALTA